MDKLYVWLTTKRVEGQGLAEYALIIALVAILLVTALGWVQGGIQTVFGDIRDALTGAGG